MNDYPGEGWTSPEQNAQFNAERLAATDKASGELAALMIENKPLGLIAGDTLLQALVANDLVTTAERAQSNKSSGELTRKGHIPDLEIAGAKQNAVDAWAKVNQLISGCENPETIVDLIGKMRGAIDNAGETNGIMNIAKKTHEITSVTQLASLQPARTAQVQPHQA